MGSKKFSELRFSWKKVWSSEEFISTFGGFITGRTLVPPSVYVTIAERGGANALSMDYSLVTHSDDVEHIFIETKGLFDFLANSPVKEPSFAHETSGEWIPAISLGTKTLRCLSRKIVLHHQYPALPSIKVMYQLLNPGTPTEAVHLFVEDGTTYAGFREHVEGEDLGGYKVPDKYYIHNLNDADVWDLSMYRYARIALNFLLYEKCFPDSISDGVPEDIANPNHWKRVTQPQHLSPAPEILSHDPQTKIPHFRSGYFKVLRSDFYKAARGKVTFVRATFVKGHAKTVSPDQDALDQGAKE